MFDSVNQRILMNLIKEYITDQPFIDILYKYLKAGYGTDLKSIMHDRNGIPQGGVLSPLLSNLYLNKLDSYIEDELMPV